MESITAKINAIFDNENDAWQEMTLEVRVSEMVARLRLVAYLFCPPLDPTCPVSNRMHKIVMTSIRSAVNCL